MGLYGPVSVLQVTGLPTMALWGWLTPRVLVPHDVTERYSQAEMRGMLLHELAHLRRRDGLWIWLGLAVCALHWFNPLAWLCLRRYLADRELECDRTALDHLSEPDRLTYGHALLKQLPRMEPLDHDAREVKSKHDSDDQNKERLKRVCEKHQSNRRLEVCEVAAQADQRRAVRHPAVLVEATSFGGND